VAAQEPGQSSAVTAGAFDSDLVDRAERLQPLQELDISVWSGSELTSTEESTDIVESCGMVGIGVSVHTADDAARLYGHAGRVRPVDCQGGAGRVGRTRR
jgi:hypothetical protein